MDREREKQEIEEKQERCRRLVENLGALQNELRDQLRVLEKQ